MIDRIRHLPGHRRMVLAWWALNATAALALLAFAFRG